MEIRKCTECKHVYSVNSVKIIKEGVMYHECCPKCENRDYYLKKNTNDN